MAVAIIIIMTVLICLSTKESSRVNLVLTCTKLVGVLFVIIAGESCAALSIARASLPVSATTTLPSGCNVYAQNKPQLEPHGAQIFLLTLAGFTKASPPNLTTDFGVYGVRGVMNGAAIIFFAYLGYDAVATLAEEVRMDYTHKALCACLLR